MTSKLQSSPSSLAETLNQQLTNLLNSGDSFPFEPPRRFTGYANRLHNLLVHILRLPPEILSSPSVMTPMKGISGDLEKVVEIMAVYKEKSNIYVLIYSRSICSSLQDLTVGIGGWLALLETGVAGFSELGKKVSELSKDMKHAHFAVTENEARVHCTLQREGEGRPTTKAVQSAIVMDLARALGIDPSNHAELSKHVKLLKKDLARSNSVSERRILMSLERIVDSFSVEPDISALSLEFDGDDDSHILPFKNFLCPLTKEVMKDPVVLESSQTYERSAIEYWFQRCLEDARDPTCPVTGQVLSSLAQKPNIGLAGAIEEWVNRNVDIQIKSAVKSLSEDPPSLDNFERVIDSMYKISEEHPSSQYKIRNAGIVVLIINLLKNRSKSIGSMLKTKALMLFLSMAKDDDSKTIMFGAGITKLAINSLVGSREKEREKLTALKLLFEFSRNETYCAKIASEKGAFVLLSSLAENLEQPALSKLAKDVLKRLEMIDENVEHLAAAGRCEPLLTRLCEGSDSVQVQMASLLGKLTLVNSCKEQIARRSASVLVQMLQKPDGRTASLHALRNLSSLDDNATILVESGVLLVAMDILLSSQNALPEHKELCAAIIASIVSNPGHWELAVVDDKGRFMHSSVIISHLMQLLIEVTPRCQVSVLQILCGIASSPKASEQVATKIKSRDGIQRVIRFLEHSETEHRICAFKLLRVLSESSSDDLISELRQQNKVILLRDKLQEQRSTESERSDAACLLANLPLSEEEVKTVLGTVFLKWLVTTIKEQPRIPSGRLLRSSSTMMEGLLGLLLHFAKSRDPQTLVWVKDNHLLSIFRDQLIFLTNPKCKQLAVLGLRHLSESGRALAAYGETEPSPPQGFCSPLVFMCGRAMPPKPTCPIHNTTPCDEDNELCLLKSDCIKPLVDLLHDENRDVQIAAIEALSTLIPETSNIYKRAIEELDNLGVVDAIVGLLIEIRPGGIQEKAIWMVERVLRCDVTSQRLSLNQSLVRALVEAMKHGNANTKNLAEDALTNLKQLSGASGKISGPIRTWR